MNTALASAYDRLTRDNTALLLVDPQVGPLWELEAAELRRQITNLARVARRLGLPTIVTTIAYDELGPIIPELSFDDSDRSVVERLVGNAWTESRVRQAVATTGRKKLVVAGSVADVGVAPCAIAAAEDGFEVYAPILSKPANHHAVQRMLEAGVIVTTFRLLDFELSRGDVRSRVLQLRR